jgi:adenylate kinase
MYQMATIHTHLTEEQKLIKRWLGSGSLNIFGRPFAGKDTQAARLAAWLEAPVIGGGDIIRSSTNLPEEVRVTNDAGQLVPQGSYLALVTPYFRRHEFDDKPLVLSSVGRWYGEERQIIASAQEAGHPIRCAIYIDLSVEQIEKRFQAAHADTARTIRADHDTLDTRLSEFANKTVPVLGTYRTLNMLITVEGTGSIEEIERRIIAALHTRAIEHT